MTAYRMTGPLPVSAEWQPEVTVPVARKMNMSVKKYSAAIACSIKCTVCGAGKLLRVQSAREPVKRLDTETMPSGTHHTGKARQMLKSLQQTL